MATRTRTITRYRTRAPARRRRTGVMGGKKIPIALVAGFLPGIFNTFQDAGTVMNTFGPKGFVDRIAYFYGGFNPWANKWDTGGLGKGLYPVLLGALVHWAAQRFGLNRAFGRWPIEI